MISDIPRMHRLINKHRQAGILVDTNLLILLFVGLLERDYIPRFERTKSFTPTDYDALLQLLRNFSRIIVTPHILTEMSNLAGRLRGDRREEFYLILAAMLADTAGYFVIDEQNRPAKLVCMEPEFRFVGLTDAGILHRASHKHFLVLTDDGPLSWHLNRRRIDFINFRDLQAYYALPLP